LGRLADGPATGLDGDLRWPHEAEGLGIWEVEPDIPRVALGVRNRVAQLKALGNSLVPQIPEMIGRAILAHEKGPPERA
jgi:DNA (cytosine-5)-methyltransferase 1